MALVLSIDAGTSGIRTLAIDEHGRVVRSAKREFPQHFPRPGWVEHDPEDIWDATFATLTEVAGATRDAGETIACIGITNQRETVVVWSRSTGRPLHRAIVWQDRRTAADCDARRGAGREPMIRTRTGLVLDPYFSASKLAWLLREGGVEASPDLAFGTVDSWLLYRLTGGRVHATDPSNASRTMLFDIGELAWSAELADEFAVPTSCLPEVLPSSGRFGVTDPDTTAGLALPVSGIAGDQQAALFGQACFEPGMAKNTYGTGSFVLVNVGPTRPDPAEGLLTTIAWQVGSEPTVYAMEGAIFVTGAAIQWLRDGLGIIADAAETGPLAESVPDNGGVMFVPAFTGLGSPYWDPYARGTILGLTRGTGRAHLAARGRRIDGVPDPGRGRRGDRGDRDPARGAPHRRRRERDGPPRPAPGRSPRSPGPTPEGPGDHRARCRVSRGARRGCVVERRRRGRRVDRGDELHSVRARRARRRGPGNLASSGRAVPGLGSGLNRAATAAGHRPQLAMRASTTGLGTRSGSSVSARDFVAYSSTYSYPLSSRISYMSSSATWRRTSRSCSRPS